MPIAKISELVFLMKKIAVVDRAYDNLLDIYNVFKEDNFHQALSYKYVKNPSYDESYNYFTHIFKEIYMKEGLFALKLRVSEKDDLYQKIMKNTNSADSKLSEDITNYYTYDIFNLKIRKTKRRFGTKIEEEIITNHFKFDSFEQFQNYSIDNKFKAENILNLGKKSSWKEDEYLGEKLSALYNLPEDIFKAYEEHNKLIKNPEIDIYYSKENERIDQISVFDNNLVKDMYSNNIFNKQAFLMKIYELKPDYFFEKIKNFKDEDAEPLIKNLLSYKKSQNCSEVDDKISKKFSKVIAKIARMNA